MHPWSRTVGAAIITFCMKKVGLRIVQGRPQAFSSSSHVASSEMMRLFGVA